MTSTLYLSVQSLLECWEETIQTSGNPQAIGVAAAATVDASTVEAVELLRRLSQQLVIPTRQLPPLPEDMDQSFLRTRNPSLVSLSSRDRQCLHSPALVLASTGDSISVRTVLTGCSPQQLRQLHQALECWMQDRVPLSQLLPSTYDDAETMNSDGEMAFSPGDEMLEPGVLNHGKNRGNKNNISSNDNDDIEVMGQARTLTTLCFQAAIVQAQLLTMPGAVGAGWVTTPTLQALASILRRWSVECVTAVKTSNGSSAWTAAPTIPKVSKKTSSKRKAPSKRKRHTRGGDDEEEEDDDDTMDDTFASEDIVEILDTQVPEPEDLVTMGLQAALELCKATLQKEFHGWSNETREITLKTVITCLVTAAACRTCRTVTKHHRLAQQVIDMATRVVRYAINRNMESEMDDAIEGDVMTRRRETTLALLSAMQTPLMMRDVVPGGEQGRLAASSVISTVFQEFVQELVDDSRCHQRRSAFRKRESAEGQTATLRTPKHIVRFQSDSVITSPTPKVPERSTPAKLKSTVKTPRSVSSVYSTTDLPNSSLSVIVGFLQKIASDTTLQKASIRIQIVQTTCQSLQHLPVLEQNHVFRFLSEKMCRGKLPVHRLVGVEVLGRILAEEWLWRQCREDRTSDEIITTIFRSFYGRLRDRVPSIRAATATALTTLLQALSKEVNPVFREKFSKILRVEEGGSLVLCLRCCTMDEKATVRKSAIEALLELLVWKNRSTNRTQWTKLNSMEECSLLQRMCRDPSVSVRKVAAEAFTRLLLQGCMDLCSSWAQTVLPLILDSETTCSSKAIGLVECVVLSPLAQNGSPAMAWDILAHLSALESTNSHLGSALRAAVVQTVEQFPTGISIREILVKVVQVCRDTLNDPCGCVVLRCGAWYLLDILLSLPNNHVRKLMKQSRVDWDFVAFAWETLYTWSRNADDLKATESLQKTMQKCLQVLSKLAHYVTADVVSESSRKLHDLLVEFTLPPDLVRAGVTAMASMMCVVGDSTAAKGRCSEWVKMVYSRSRDCLRADLNNPLKIAHAIFTVGETSMIGFCASDDARDTNLETSSEPLRGMWVRPSQELVDILMAFLPHYLPCSEKVITPEIIRAHAFITIGKLCLRDETLAKRSLNMFAQELHNNLQHGSSKVQSNALLVLGDLCLRYTNLVDRFLPIMASCLQAGLADFSEGHVKLNEGSAVVRQHAVFLLSNLLLQDYIKWRGLLFYRFLVATVDDADEVSNLATSRLCGPLLTRYPKLFVNQFVESIFVLNRCTAHPIYVAASSMGDGGSGIIVGFDGISLSGEFGRLRRMHMYNLMIQNLSDEEKISVTARITKEVLGSALENGNDLNRVCITSGEFLHIDESTTMGSALNVLKDALAILSNPSMKVGKVGQSSTPVDEEIEDNSESVNPKKKVQAAKGRLLSIISRKHLIENILPILCKLKSVLQKSHSTLLKDLMIFLVTVFRQYNKEVKDFLANDPALLQELEYDARQYHKSKRCPSSSAADVSTFTVTSPLSSDETFLPEETIMDVSVLA